jgi:hypothetical protein
MSQESIASLSISALKSILFTNHVNAGQILEKSDLVKKVMTLIEDEKAERERQRQAEEREEMELMQREAERREAVRQRALERERAEREAADAANSAAAEDSGGDQVHQDGSGENPVQSSEDAQSNTNTSPIPSSSPKSVATPPKTKGSATTLERTGLCVVCQDEEANIAIVDCGWVYFLLLSSIDSLISCVLFSQAYGYVPRLFRSHHGKLARVSSVSHPHRHRSPSATDFQDLDTTPCWVRRFF